MLLSIYNDHPLLYLIAEVPDPPMEVTAFANGARWVALRWQPGFDGNRPILSFVIQRVNLNETNSTYVLVTQEAVGDLMQNNGFFMYNVSNPELILPFTNYRFRVQACNELGCGGFEPSMDIMTEEDSELLIAWYSCLQACCISQLL